jgi:bacteriocin-like protein
MTKPQDQQKLQTDDQKSKPQDPKKDEKLTDKDLDKVSGGMMPLKPKDKDL